MIKQNLYRLNVGMMIINKFNDVFIGKRIGGTEYCWQMPQGGIDKGESPRQTVMREMKEEIGSNNASILAESNWYYYDIPTNLMTKSWDKKFCGQQQKWFLIKFLGNDSDININTTVPEFNEWKWSHVSELPKIVISFKKNIYIEVIKEFESFFMSKKQ